MRAISARHGNVETSTISLPARPAGRGGRPRPRRPCPAARYRTGWGRGASGSGPAGMPGGREPPRTIAPMTRS